MNFTTRTKIDLPDLIRGGRDPWTGPLGEWLQASGDAAIDRLLELMHQHLPEKRCDALAEQWDLDQILTALASEAGDERVLRELTDDPNAVIIYP